MEIALLCAVIVNKLENSYPFLGNNDYMPHLIFTIVSACQENRVYDVLKKLRMHKE